MSKNSDPGEQSAAIDKGEQCVSDRKKSFIEPDEYDGLPRLGLPHNEPVEDLLDLNRGAVWKGEMTLELKLLDGTMLVAIVSSPQIGLPFWLVERRIGQQITVLCGREEGTEEAARSAAWKIMLQFSAEYKK